MKKYAVIVLTFVLQVISLQNSWAQKADISNQIYAQLGAAYKTPAFSMKGYWVWCSTVIKGDDNKYHMYASRWPDSLLFHPGWMVASEVVHAVADKPEGPYTFSDVALPARGAQYWDGRSTHNPRVLRYKNKYVLYYMGSTHPFEEPNVKEFSLTSKWCIVGRSNKRVGVAISDSPYGPWKRFDEPVLETEPNTFYSFLTSNPSPIIEADGSVLMIFKARNYEGNDHYSPMCFGLACAKSIYDKFKVLNNNQPVLGGPDQPEIEDPFFWKDQKGYHVIFKDHVAKYTGEKGAGVLANSKDAIHWTIDPSPKAYSRTLRWDDGTTETMGQLERPFIFFQNRQPAYLFFATMDGLGGFENGTHTWNMVVPFKK
ncbi:glycoside hydrolase family protein [Chitinophagaceae bacterium LB-8]|uniref:Glycoside hydrolase family protein n=1 Tax=Paraflavisolibacter caeni TaxID=2982496 RepID=A0A9X3BKE9_9BACT|nr:glycoside hydrolase family protein [Paraflavisolibacter caeni]MCU7552863.1 glycoside hydrolase family protein [Paraflavisolibacter caeni]